MVIAESTDDSATGIGLDATGTSSATSVKRAGIWFAEAGTTPDVSSDLASWTLAATLTLQSTDLTPSVWRAATMTRSSCCWLAAAPETVTLPFSTVRSTSNPLRSI